MTTFESRAIKSRSGKDLVVKHKRDDVHLVCSGIDGDGGHLRIFKRADLLAALDAVPVAEANQSIEHELAQRDEAVRLSHEYRNRAEKAEALVGVERAFKEKAIDRAEKAEADHADTKAAYRALGASHAELLTRAEKAEAVIERVRALTVDGDGEWIHRGDLRGALDPKPAFTLPTEAGARFTAQGKYDAIGQRTEFITFTGGTAPRYIVADKDEDVCYTGAGVMTHYEDHRLLDNNGAGPVTAEDIEGLDSSDVGADQ